MISPRRCIAYLFLFVVVVVVGIIIILPKGHQHCIKQAHSILSIYAGDNDGRFPSSEKGWADALLALEGASDNGAWIDFCTNGDDKGDYFRQALASGNDIDESIPSRIYVQGLSSESYGGIAILFDRQSTSGGDHGPSLFNTRPMLREVISVNGMMETVRDTEWPAFVKKQKELLKEEGFTPAQIAEIYGEF